MFTGRSKMFEYYDIWAILDYYTAYGGNSLSSISLFTCRKRTFQIICLHCPCRTQEAQVVSLLYAYCSVRGITRCWWGGKLLTGFFP